MVLLPLLLLANGALAALPQVDFDRMGRVGLAGAFAGLDFFQDTSISYDPSTSTIFTRNSEGALTRLGSTNQGGRISAACSLNDVLYVAGSFTSLDDSNVNDIASFSFETNRFNALGSGGPNGAVEAVFCDTRENRLWVGGRFTTPSSAVAVWDPSSNAWSAAPFGGLSGAQSRVSSITTNSSDESLFFSGSFIAAFGNSSISLNGTNNPNVPFSAGASPFSSSLVPLPLQGGQIEGSPSSTDPDFGDINSILCPAGDDGPGNTWFAADGVNGALITVRTFAFMSANGIRLGNTFLDQHGTTGFSVTTIPDNSVRTLTYVDPTTGENRTCSDPCPLSTDSSLLYQDFLFEEPLEITGVQITLSEFTGVAPGLHILQILSSGAFASSLPSNNSVSCFAPNPSNTTQTGTWTPKVANTNIAATTQTVLVSSVDAGTSSSQGPTFTWMPYVSASGLYEVHLLTPGCTNFQDCSRRTSVRVTVFPGDGLDPWVTTVSQTNTEDATTVIYSGPILPSSPDFVTTITMMLADGATSQEGPMELVADRVLLILTSPDPNNSGVPTNGTTTQGARNSFGFFEWPRNAQQFEQPEEGSIRFFPTDAITALDEAGFDLLSGLGASGSAAGTSNAVNIVVHHPSAGMFLGGNFTLSSSSGSAANAANIVQFVDGELRALPAVNGASTLGVDGEVRSMILVGDSLFVGGSFEGGVLRYDVQERSWSSLGGGVTGANGSVSSLNYEDGRLQVAGNFNQAAGGSDEANSIAANGFAVWDVEQGKWVPSGGFVVGAMTLIANTTATRNDRQVLAGNVGAAHQYGSSGLVLLQSGPVVTPIGAELANEGSASAVAVGDGSSSTRSSTVAKRGHFAKMLSHSARHGARRYIAARQSSPTRLPPPPSAPAPAVLAGIFWTNTTSGDEVAIIGGNFTFGASGQRFSGIGVYDPQTSAIQPLQGPQINGVVYALFIDGNSLYVGGRFTIEGLNVNGLAIYDLVGQRWNVDGLQALQPAGGSSDPVIVRSISKSGRIGANVVVAGSFGQAGSLRCEGICGYDSTGRQWNTLGNGVRGEVASVAYAGEEQEFLIASGSIALDDSGAVNVARYSLNNSTWVPLGSISDLPGPVTAMEINNGNASSIFVAGTAVDGSAAFLSFWNGVQWAVLDTGLQPSTTVAQLTMVPLQDTHSGNNIIQSDRMLMVSGSLADENFGSASSALFDGQNLIPYIVTSTASGTTGMVASLFRSFTTFSFDQRRFLATGVVILISIAIAAGVVFLLALIGILWTLFSRRDDKLEKFNDYTEEDDESIRHRPSSLLEHINAATRTTILGASSPFAAGYGPDREEEKTGNRSAGSHGRAGNLTPEPGFASSSGHGAVAGPSTAPNPGKDDPFFIRADTPSDAIGGVWPEGGRPARARYSFEATGEGELDLHSGEEVEVLDERDASWWYARNTRTGREGVVPAAYLY
ncbi:hypothetical protein AX16_006980 [Volvariella volvacea WC 439]|nr:hypothetical protein AX16_006980 [Volvariella volvacea WC 439]